MPSDGKGDVLDRGRLSLGFTCGPNGKTYISHQLATYPFHVCRAHYLEPEFPELVTLYTQSCSGGLYAGDSLTTAIHLYCGAAVHLTTQASTIVHATKGDLAVSSVAITCDDSAFVEYVPDPLILFSGARLQSSLAIAIHPSSFVLIADSFLCHDPERVGRLDISYENKIVISDLAGHPFAQETIRISDDLMNSDLIGIMGGFQAYGSLFVLLPSAFHDEMISRVRETTSKLAGSVIGVSALPSQCGLSIRILATEGVSLRKAIIAVWSQSRAVHTGRLPAPPRK